MSSITHVEGNWRLAPRWQIVAAILIIAGTANGMALIVAGRQSGHDLAFAALLASIVLAPFSELRKPPAREPDEREMNIRLQAYNFGASVPLLLVAVWAWIVGVFADAQLWRPHSAEEWRSLSVCLIALWGGISVLTAALLTPAYASTLAEDD